MGSGRWGVAVVALVAYLAYYLPQAQIDVLEPGWWLASFLVASALLNLGAVLRGGSLVLNRADLVLVYIMLLMVSALCTMGMSQQLLPIIAAFFLLCHAAEPMGGKAAGAVARARHFGQ